jgi:hypothetical protein
MKQGSPPFLHRRTAHRPNPADRRRVAREGGAKELAPEVRVLIWCIDSRGAHRGGLAAVKQGLTVVGSRRWGTGDDMPEKRWRAPARGSWSDGELEWRMLQ